MNSNDPFTQRDLERRQTEETSAPSESITMQNQSAKGGATDIFSSRSQERRKQNPLGGQQEEEGIWDWSKRFGARQLSSLQSNIAGLPSLAEDLAGGASNIIKSVGEKFLPEELKGKKGYLLEEREKKFKTPKEFKELNKNLFGKKLLEPRNEWEKVFDEVTDDFILGAMPLTGGPLRFARPLFAAIASNAAKEGVKFVGGSEKAQSNTKIGALMASYLINPGSARQLENRLYNQQNLALPQNASIDAPHLQSFIRSNRNRLQRGGSAPSKTEAIRKLDELEEAFVNGRIPMRELTEFKKSINELIADRYSAIGVSKEGSAATLHNLNRIGTAVDRTISRYGRRNPNWHNIYRQANEVHGALSRGAQIRNWLDKQRSGALKNAGLAHALGHGISAPVATGAIAAELSIRAASIAIIAKRTGCQLATIQAIIPDINIPL